jgi:hypothetical protein
MPPEIIDCTQRDEDWHLARCGIPTASEFATIIAKGRTKDTPSLTRRAYMCKLAGERITGIPEEGYCNGDMRRGIAMEGEALRFYAFLEPRDVRNVGFIRNGRVGASPDALVGLHGLLEIKTAKPSVLLPIRERGSFPPEHRAQVQGQLWVAERDWSDLLVYWPNVPHFLVRVHRDEEYIKMLADEAERFCDELDAMVDRLMRDGSPDAAAREAEKDAIVGRVFA